MIPPLKFLNPYKHPISHIWLVVTGTFLWLSHHIGNNNPNWLSYFSEGLKPPTRHMYIYYMIYIYNHRASRDVVFIFLHIYCPTHPQFTKHDLLPPLTDSNLAGDDGVGKSIPYDPHLHADESAIRESGTGNTWHQWQAPSGGHLRNPFFFHGKPLTNHWW